MLDIQNYANLKPETPFNRLFPDGRVPVSHPLPIKPTDEAPVCWQIDGKQLTEGQLQGLAEMMSEKIPEMSLEDIKAEILSNGLPMNQAYFTGVSITDPKTIAALVIDADYDYEQDIDEDDDWDDSDPYGEVFDD